MICGSDRQTDDNLIFICRFLKENWNILEYSRTHEDLAATTSPCRDDPWPWRHGSVTMTWRSVRTGLYIHLCVSGTGTKLSQDRIKQGVCCNIFAFFFSPIDNLHVEGMPPAVDSVVLFWMEQLDLFFVFGVWGHVFHFSKTCSSAISCSHDHFPWKQGSQWRSNSAIQRVQGDLIQVTAMGSERRAWVKLLKNPTCWFDLDILPSSSGSWSELQQQKWITLLVPENLPECDPMIQWSNKNPSVQLFLMWSIFDVGKSNNKPSQYDSYDHKKWMNCRQFTPQSANRKSVV